MKIKVSSQIYQITEVTGWIIALKITKTDEYADSQLLEQKSRKRILNTCKANTKVENLNFNW